MKSLSKSSAQEKWAIFVANIKNTSDVKIGDTVTLQKILLLNPFPAFALISPVVFAGIYPVDSSDFEAVRDALVKLQLNDSALHVEQESSLALGFGFRCGFLGLLHLEIVFERLQREFNLDIITTAPSVVYKFTLTDGEAVQNRQRRPLSRSRPSSNFVEEPWVKMPHHGPCRISRRHHEPWHGKARRAAQNRDDGCQTPPPHLPLPAQRDHHRFQ